MVGGSNPLVPTIFFIVALFLLTNDDGIDAEGLKLLEKCLDGLGETVVVAPDRERSAVSHSLTLRTALELRQLRPNYFTLNGTPADCVIYALANVLTVQPDLVISGINHGANLGDDIMYSGTVAAAREASHRGIAAVAVSQAYDESPIRFEKGAKFVRTLVMTILERRSGSGLCLNVNIPVRRIRGVKITRQGCSQRFPHFNSLDRGDEAATADPEIVEDRHKSKIPADFQTIMEHYISVTPLQRDQTDYAMVDSLLKDPPRLFRRFRLPGIGLIG
ncbi:MAG: 5'/3'-nucleotidase SurE [Acidobacteriia bacterium]|nr:5'/3'-nucleotidase SurE [Terriglobia bacterium]